MIIRGRSGDVPGIRSARPALQRLHQRQLPARKAPYGHALGGRAGLLLRRGFPAMERHPQRPHAEMDAGRRRYRVPQALQLRQWPHPRPGRAPGLLRARRPARDPHGVGRLDHRAGRQLQGQAAQLAQRRGGEVRRHGVVHRSALRHSLRLRGPQGRERDRRLPRLPLRPQEREAHHRRRRLRQAERSCLLARREDPLHRRHRRLARSGGAAPHPRLQGRQGGQAFRRQGLRGLRRRPVRRLPAG